MPLPPWAKSIQQRVANRDMPPWHLDKTVGIKHYKNDRSLSDEQISTIVRWVDAGALLRAISACRLPEAIDFLLDVLKTGTARQSAAAAEALKPHEDSPEIQARIAAIRKARQA